MHEKEGLLSWIIRKDETMIKHIVVRKTMLLATLLTAMICGGCQRTQQEVIWQIETEDMQEQSQQDNSHTEVTAEMPEIHVCVYLCGAVAEPGVYELAEGSRLYEAIELAGGLKPEADATHLNLARVLLDGEQILVMTTEEVEKLQESGSFTYDVNHQDTQQTLININTATKEQLMTLSGIGEGRAEAILQYREEKGTFQRIEQIMEVSGIKNALYDKIKDKITV